MKRIQSEATQNRIQKVVISLLQKKTMKKLQFQKLQKKAE